MDLSKILFCNELNAEEKLIYITISYLKDIGSDIYIDNIKEITSMSRPRITRTIKSLEDKNLIKKKRRGLTLSNTYQINDIDNISKPEENLKSYIYIITDGENYTGLRRNSMACVAFPTCGLAMAESERYLPSLISKIENLLDEAGLNEEEITIRMTGCPNGCARPALAEIAFIGKGPGKYNMYLGGGFTGDRLNKIYKENIGEAEILESLKPILIQYAKERTEGEHFGDFVVRAGIVEEVRDGQTFHS